MPIPPNFPGLHRHLAELVGGHVSGVWIEAGQHTVECTLHQFLVGDRIDVLVTHALEYVAKQGEQSVGIGTIGDLGVCGVDAPDRTQDAL